MKIAILTSATGGGAGIAANRLHKSMKLCTSEEVDCDLITIDSLGGSAVGEDVVPASGGSNKKFSDTHYTIEYNGFVRSSVVSKLAEYDVINIHWCSFLITTTEILRLQMYGSKIIFTCHDYYYYYGGCHYPHTCDNWLNECNRCPQLSVETHPDYSSHLNYLAKAKIRQNSFTHYVAPSSFLIESLIANFNFPRSKTRVIRNPIDDKVFNHGLRSKTAVKSRPPRVLIIADSALEQRKGFAFAYNALCIFRSTYSDTDIEVVIAGKGSDIFRDKLNHFGIKANSIERIDNESDMAELYCSVDIVFSPSLEDNWPNILVEGFACGCLLLVGPGHGCEEFVKLYRAGEISKSYSPEDFAFSLYKLISKVRFNWSPSLDSYNQFLSDHSPITVGGKYIELYKKVMSL